MIVNSAIILCGGRGTRLGALGKKFPKTLLKVHGKPIIWYIIKFLIRNSFNHFILPVGYKGGMIKKYFTNNLEFKKNNIEIIETGEKSLIAKRIFKVKKLIKSENFLLLNGDAIFNFNLKKIFKEHQDSKNFATFLGSEVKLPYGIIGVKKNKIISFERETYFNKIISNSRKNFIGNIYSGICILRKDLLNLEFKKFDNFEKKLYPIIIKKFKSKFVNINALWCSIDNQKDLFFLNKNKKDSIYKKIKKLRILLK
jgi:glucose-1-phosphate cytidylyltransferase